MPVASTTENSFGLEEIVRRVNEHPLLKNKKLPTGIIVNSLSNDAGVDLSLPLTECEFRKTMLKLGFTASRQNINTSCILFSLRMRRNRFEDCVKLAVAFALYKNNMLVMNEEAV